jgi:hypothetical protein
MENDSYYIDHYNENEINKRYKKYKPIFYISLVLLIIIIIILIYATIYCLSYKQCYLDCNNFCMFVEIIDINIIVCLAVCLFGTVVIFTLDFLI